MGTRKNLLLRVRKIALKKQKNRSRKKNRLSHIFLCPRELFDQRECRARAGSAKRTKKRWRFVIALRQSLLFSLIIFSREIILPRDRERVSRGGSRSREDYPLFPHRQTSNPLFSRVGSKGRFCVGLSEIIPPVRPRREGETENAINYRR